MSTVLHVERADGLMTLTVDRPRAANALDGAVHATLLQALSEAKGDPSVRAVILAAAGERVFSAGADLREYPDLPPFEAGVRRRTQLVDSLVALLDFEKPLVCAVQGKAIGAGWMLALCTDAIVASEVASFSLPEIRLGTPTPIGVALLVARVGEHQAGRLAQSGETVSAIAALRRGLVEEVVPAARLTLVARERAAALAALAPAAFAGNKRWIHRAPRERLIAATALAAEIHAASHAPSRG